MLLSLNHINKFLPNKKLTHKEVEIALNNLGIEVEGTKKFSDVEGLLFANVLDVKDNPNSDRLDIVKLETKNGIIQIQTTNRILKSGDFIVCFPVGAKKGDFTFGAKKLKGELSEGMMAAWSEIGYKWDLLAEKDEILVLPKNFATINDDPIKLLGLDDYIIEISLTTNRNDLNSYYFVAKEIAAYYNTEFKFNLEKIEPTFESNIKVKNTISSELSFSEVKGNKETTLYEKMLLAKHDISSQHNWAVNLTNLTLLNTGATAHVYDKNKVSDQITDEIFTGKIKILGNKEIEIKNVLIIKDDKRPISIASVMGLEDTKSDLNSTEFIFEVGVFPTELVRHGAKEIKLSSNSSSQASRVISSQVANIGMEYIRNYVKDLKISQTINPIKVPSNKKIFLDYSLLKLYGQFDDLDKLKDSIEKLSNLDFKIKNNEKEQKIEVIVPNYRYDIELDVDIIEELFRIYSYDNFNPNEYLSKPYHVTQKRNNLKQKVVNQGYTEARTFTLVSEEKSLFNPFQFEKNMSLMTFVSKERQVVRNSIITSLQEVVEYNQKRKISDINIFEKGMINNNRMVLGLATTTKDYLTFKNDLINILNQEVKFTRNFKYQNKNFDLDNIGNDINLQINPYASAYIIANNTLIGWIGKLHPKNDNTNAFYAEILLDSFSKPSILEDNKLQNISNNFSYKSIDLTPLKTIDITFSIETNMVIENLINEINEITNNEIYSIKKIDEYQKDNNKQITFRISASNRIVEVLNSKYNA
ncbi:phenylalanine--tRNA ligase subunit beta [Mycoplasma sp. CSL10166]|uniref:phenylalanine--tRNA ligase subunit beta n=1 Tax=Mycoplasma sp. CSL10166 TaxID=2813825 RepID=UPI00197B2ED7|nr:phenylalanine--tRNA ligase subunit beta [Mycoplasma sp. CSL10166]MBN4084367.1 phenylalanine--tRNA ligase subunit beta [Mycoplasma sp. CSL10166]